MPATAHTPGVEDDALTPMTCARLLDARLHETLTTPFRLDRGRLYGCTGDGGDVRFSFLGDDRDVYLLLAGPIASMARQFDAAAVAMTGWAAPMPDGPAAMGRPSQHPERYRIRVCCAVGSGGVASVMRAERDPGTVLEMPGPGEGAMPRALLQMWSGAATARSATRRPAASGRAAGRHRRPA